MISFKALDSQWYSEPFKPYIYTGICHGCLNDGQYGESIRRGAEGKEIGNKLYVRLVCHNNPSHNGEWNYHGKRPLKFRLKKILKRIMK